jgi:hypothetical protein
VIYFSTHFLTLFYFCKIILCYNSSMITRIKEAKSLSSSSAFIIIIVLVIVSVAAIVVGGGDAFSRKYAGIDLREFSGKMLLAQTGVVGKILKFEQDGDIFTLDLLPIELDSTLLDSGERYVTSVVPPREGDTPFSYRPEEGVRVTQGYPILREYTEQHNIVSALSAAASLSVSEEETNELPDIPGMKMCNVGSTVGHFDVFYEDIAYDTNIGFDDPNLGVARQNEICEALNEFEEILLLDELKLKPGIVIQASTEKTPEHTLSVVSPQYVGGSGFVSTLLADYLRSGEKRSDTSFSENVSVLGINSGFMRFSFANDVRWSSDTGNSEDFDMSTVAKQNMLRLLGFGSFIGHEQENILSSTWERWTEWDRLLFDSEYNPLIDSGMKFVNSSISQEDLELSESNEYDNILVNQTPVNISGFNIPDVSTVPFAEVNSYEIFKSSRFLKGESLSGLANEDALSYPILGRGEVKNVSQQEKEILCFLGLGVSGVEGCEDGPRAVAQDIYIERQNNKPVCVNIGRGLESSVAQKFVLAGEIMEMTGNVDIYNSNQFMMFSAPCDGPEFESIVKRDAFANLHQTENIENARSFAWTPSSSESLYREYVQFAFSTKDIVTGRQTDQQTVSIHKCVVTANGNQLCNGDFQFSGATSAIDYKLSALQDVTLADGSTVVACQSTTLPGWCAQGVQDGFSSEFGYTWHPYLIRNPEAFDASINDSPRVYAGGSSGAIIQRLRVPLQQNTSYLVTGKVYVTQDGLRPTFWYGPQNTILRQSDGTYHVHYPEALTGGGPVIREYTLAEPLTEGEWHDFSWTLESGTDPITHIAFGSSNNNGFVLYDNLSVVAINECGTCMSDVDGNCVTNVTDFTTFLDTYGGVCPGETVGCLGDLTFDGAVDTEDILEFISQYGSSCDDGTSDVEICNDRIDNDGDGKIDGADLDCAQSPVEICSDRRDNDGDGLIDMNDPDCFKQY